MEREISHSPHDPQKTAGASGIERALTHALPLLLVDDEKAVLQAAEHALTAAGYTRVKARSAAPALIALESSQDCFDLLITLVRVGGMSGLVLLKQKVEPEPLLTVITMSGTSEVETPVEAVSRGARRHLIKPLDIDDLLQSVSRALGKSEAAAREKRRREADHAQWETAAHAFALSLDARDKETVGHAERVVAYSVRLGRELELGTEEIRALELGARLHDIGKIAVPDRVLKKPHGLTEEEWVVMRNHPAKGQQMVRSMKLPEGAAMVVGQHHERWDGTGYPGGLSGDDIYLGARVFSVVDTFDAITSDRCYRRGRRYQDALEEILAHSGTQFDPRVVETFSRIDPEEWEQIRRECPSDVTDIKEAVAG